MLVTFQTKAYSDITMFGDVALRLLNMMGHSGAVPGAIKADDVPEALRRLQEALAAHQAAGADDEPEERDDDRKEPRVGLAKRAFPLIALLTAAAERRCDVMWRS